MAVAEADEAVAGADDTAANKGASSFVYSNHTTINHATKMLLVFNANALQKIYIL